jgi:uncharacterized membrane protein
MIDYLINNWIDLGILLVLIFILINTARDSWILNITLHGIDGRLREIKKEINPNALDIDEILKKP